MSLRLMGSFGLNCFSIVLYDQLNMLLKSWIHFINIFEDRRPIPN